MKTIKPILAGGLLAVSVFSAAWALGVFQRDDDPAVPAPEPNPIGRMAYLDGGAFRMGNDLSTSPDERPAHEVSLGPFYIDAHEVANRQFARFVEQTGYQTTAQRRGWSYVFDHERGQWIRQSGADWQHPGGPDTSLLGRDEYPVVHVSWYDAAAYADWAGKQLPTEAQWEYAARSGLRDADYPWGREEMPEGRYMANYRQHDRETAADGFEGLAPVRSFPPSRFGLYDLSGNVWEWCRDRHGEDYYGASPRENPPGPSEGQTRVVRGGSFLSPENYRCGHHVSTRGHHRPEETFQHLGFRCVRPAR
ncbi:MAG TPA: formylglycine-generating enzyme family protein [Thermoguttaceae bacterium]|nr:formylglycine-generating enzyme family protein [Thermoguttaceae bacterium]